MTDYDSPPDSPTPYHRAKVAVLIVNDLRDYLFPLAVVNFAAVALALTLIGLPPAVAALHATVHDTYFNRAPSLRGFAAHVRRWAGWSYAWAAGNLALFAAATLLYQASEQARFPVGQGAVLVLGTLVVAFQYYFWAFMIIQDRPNPLRAFRNSAFTALGDPPLFILNVGVSLFIGVPAVVLIAPVLFLLPVLLTMIAVYQLLLWLAHHGHMDSSGRNV